MTVLIVVLIVTICIVLKAQRHQTKQDHKRIEYFPILTNSTFSHSTPIRAFLTFGGPSPMFHRRVYTLCEQALSLSFFNITFCLTDVDLKSDTVFWQKHGNFIESNRRGYGYWIWKSYLVSTIFSQLSHDSILVYMDVGCHFNALGMKRMHEYLDILYSNNLGIVSFQMSHPEKYYTKAALAQFLNATEIDMNSSQFLASAMLLRKVPHAVKFVNNWYEVASNYNSINDDRGNEWTVFIDHRHDQSAYSLLVKRHGANILNDETYFSPHWRTKGVAYPIWVMRDKH